jgi:hypothetical protein
MRALVTSVAMELDTTASVVSTAAWSRKVMVDVEPVAVLTVVEGDVPARLVLEPVVPA